jgi:SAM-dependent methyltransferase
MSAQHPARYRPDVPSLSQQRMSPVPIELADLHRALPADGAVLDVGCFGYRQLELARQVGRGDLRHAGVDYNDYDDVPAGFRYRKADLNNDAIPFGDDEFDLVVARHVLEHVSQPLRLVREALRVCKPGGLVYLEAPSERSLWLPGMQIEQEKFFSTSFFDDPTHLGRPWSSQAFVRMARYFGCEPLRAGYQTDRSFRTFARLAKGLLQRRGALVEQAAWKLVGWASFALIQKPLTVSGEPPFRYYIPANR